MAIYHATSSGLKKIKDTGTSGVYFCPGRTNCLTYVPHNIDFERDPLNVAIVGNPSVNRGVVSNFSSGNYLIIDKFDVRNGQSWECVFKFNLTTISKQNILFGSPGSRSYQPRFYITSSNKVSLYLSTNSSSWNLVKIVGTTTITANTTYWAKAEFTGSAYNIYLSTDGINYNLEATKTSTTAWTVSYQFANIGYIYDSGDSKGFPLYGSIDLSQSYIKINGELRWKGGTGGLILKAGSKVYVPNGAGDFKAVTTSMNVSLDLGANATGTQYIYGIYSNDNITNMYHYGDMSSGANWNAEHQYECRYNTADNFIKNTNDTGNNWGQQLSFPLAKTTAAHGEITSVDQTFQWCGYVGSTIFVLPGVKGLCSNGFNPDDTYKVAEKTIDKVLITTRTWNANYNQHIVYRGNENIIGIQTRLYTNKTMPSPNSYSYWLDTSDNKMYVGGTKEYTSKSQFTEVDDCLWLAQITGNGTSSIASITPYNVKTNNDLIPIEKMYRENQLVYDVSQFAPGYIVKEIASPSSTHHLLLK